MTTTQKSMLGCSVLSYLLVLFSFFRFDLWLILIFFIIHSLVMLTLAFLFWKNTVDDEGLHHMIAEQEKQLSAANTRIRALTDEIAALRDAAAEAALAAAETAGQTAAEAAAPEPVEAEPQPCAASYEALLPPVDPDEAENETLDILAIAKDTIRELSAFASAAHIELVLSAPESSLLVKANRSRLRILFRNIIDNSIKYMHRSGSLLITISNIGDDIFIVLKDNGAGLSETETSHIFELNYQGSNRVSGNGLGLTQAKAIVDYYGGSIYAKSTVGRGMGIYIQLPTT